MGWRHERRALVLDEKCNELGWLGRARITTDNVHVVWTLVEGLTGTQCDLLRAPYLHDDRALDHVDEHVRIVAMDRAFRADAYSTVNTAPSSRAPPARSCAMSGVTFVVSAAAPVLTSIATIISNRFIGNSLLRSVIIVAEGAQRD